MTPAKKLAVIGAIAGAVIAIALGIATTARRSPTGPGENLMWLQTYAAILGAPVSFIADSLQLRVDSLALRILVVLAAIPINWTLIGFVLGLMFDLFRRGR